MAFNLTISKSGLPCLWESGGGATNTGGARIIADRDGQPKKPIYIKRRGQLSCKEHALIPIQVGDYVVEVSHHRRGFHTQIWRITVISDEEVTAELVAEYDYGEWDSKLPETHNLFIVAFIIGTTSPSKVILNL